jgi:hypothetical protein
MLFGIHYQVAYRISSAFSQTDGHKIKVPVKIPDFQGLGQNDN